MNDRKDMLHALLPRDSDKRRLSRRQFMRFAGSGALAGSAACSLDAPREILPYTIRPADVIPGKSRLYATSMLLDGYATGLLAVTREGRPIKLEGNPDHPTSLGATSALQQATVLQLYDPDRAQVPQQRGRPSTWPELAARLSRTRDDGGAGLRLVLEPTSSPLVHAELSAIKRRFPAAKVTFYSGLSRDAEPRASLRLFGRALAPQYHVERADVIVALDSDFLASPYDLRPPRQFAARRQLDTQSGDMNRLYVLEAALSVTGSVADHRLARPARRVAPLTAALAAQVLGGNTLQDGAARAAVAELDADDRHFIAALARDLRSRPSGRTLVLPGGRQPEPVHVLAHAMNAALGNLGQTLHFSEPAIPDLHGDQSLGELVEEMLAGAIDSLLVFDTNLAYCVPADIPLATAMQRVPHSAYFGLYQDETARLTQWFAPLAHALESWGDGFAYDGTLSLVQPVIRPLYGSWSLTELLGTVAGEPQVSDYRRLRARFGAAAGERLALLQSDAEWNAHVQPAVTERFQVLLQRGFAEGSALPLQVPAAASNVASVAFSEIAAAARDQAGKVELNLLPSPSVRDGRFANLSWLQELPDPITKLTWDNAALLSPATAKRLGIEPRRSAHGHPMLELALAEHSLKAPALVVPGHADDSVTLWLGYGRQGEEHLAAGVGVNAYRLHRSDALAFVSGLQLTRTHAEHVFAFTQPHQDMEDRPVALVRDLDQYRADPDFTAEHKRPQPTLLADYTLGGPQWAMSIDLSKCIGCSACMVACQAENNVLAVGKEQVSRGREMAWLRLDSYYLPRTSGGAARMVHQPMACQHCEHAPCEYVCPVNATVHSPDGLNEMVYNRCIGTRFCSNNCPYKVRRFNYFDWSEREPARGASLALQRNPEVTVRERGVMEKCTYCVQRIRAAEIDARIERRAIRPGEVVTACQQACPTRAIEFDSLHHTGSEMVRSRAQPRSYALLNELGTKPRTMYLARIDNPNPELG